MRSCWKKNWKIWLVKSNTFSLEFELFSSWNSRTSSIFFIWRWDDSIKRVSIISSIQSLILFWIVTSSLFPSNSRDSQEILYVKSICFFCEISRILSEISIWISDRIQSKKFEGNHASSEAKREGSKKSYFGFLIISTKKWANKRSYFFAFFSSFCTLLIHAADFLTDSLNFSEIYADFGQESIHSLGIKSSNHIKKL